MSNHRRPKRPRAKFKPESHLSDLDGLFVDAHPQAQPAAKKRKKAPKTRRKDAFDDEDALAATAMDLNAERESSGLPRSKSARRHKESEHKESEHKGLGRKREERPMSDRNFAFSAGVLTCVKGPETGLALKLIEGNYTIGRGRDNHFVLKDIAASREHIRVEVCDNEIRVVDLGSGNGTRVNGKRIHKPRILEHGDRIRIGKSTLEFTFVGDDRSRDFVPNLANHAAGRVVEKADEFAKELAARRGQSEEFDEADLALEMLDFEMDEAEPSNAHMPDLLAEGLWNETETEHADVILADAALVNAEAQNKQPQNKQPVQPAMSAQQAVHEDLAAMPEIPPTTLPQPASQSNAQLQMLILGLLFMAATFVVSVGGFAIWWWGIRDAPEGEKVSVQIAKVSEQDVAENQKRTLKKTSLMEAAETAMEEGDLDAARAWAEKALNWVPGDAAAVELLTRIERLRASQAGKELQKAKADAQAAVQKAAAQKAAEKRAARERAKAKILQERAAAERMAAERARENAASRARAAKNRARAKEKERARARARERAAAKARAKAQARSKMKDADAKALFKKAIRQFRDGDERPACASMKKIVKKAEASSTWHKKAESFRGRKCR